MAFLQRKLYITVDACRVRVDEAEIGNSHGLMMKVLRCALGLALELT